ncbi:MAG: hypothetical protein FGM48_04830 [Candidatus Nanopelagicaceae bacterium]|nr:hypothetical protein [Candidatus Nanopelagicaceae bacterium]
MRKTLVALVALSLISGSANAATKKPTPTPTPTKKVTAQPTSKATVKTTVKPTATAKTTAKTTTKATVKATPTATKKKVVYKPAPRKKVKLSPSPAPVWPPKGYLKSDDIYAKIPTSKELIGLSSANKKLAAELKSCESLTCGAILATSLAGCKWWEITADVNGPTSDTDPTIINYGNLRSLFGPSKAKQINSYILISEEPIKNGLVVSNIIMACHRTDTPVDVQLPSHVYVKAA